eukprot:COSAG02_NODE_1797_length_10902_cov_25.030177_1_plen_193_part_00
MSRICSISLKHLSNRARLVLVAFWFLHVVFGGYYGSSGNFTLNGSIIAPRSSVLFASSWQLTRSSSFYTRHAGGCNESSTKDLAWSSNAHNGRNLGGSPSSHNTQVQNKGRGLQVTTRYQMTNTILNTAVIACKQESTTFECTNTENTYGPIETWDVSSVTTLSQSKQPLDWSFVVRGRESGWSGSNCVSFG